MEGRLKSAILSVTGNDPKRTDVRYFAAYCLQVAQIYLKRKTRYGRLDPRFFGLSLEDLALDCIADLFQRENSGRFPQLASYFEPLRSDERDEAALIAATRRLVFSKVSEGLFRRYREADPGLGKMIRNLRYAISRTPDVHETRHNGALWTVFGREDETSIKPVMPPEFLEARLGGREVIGFDLKQTIMHVGCVLAEHPVYASAYPLTGLAGIVRSILERLADAPEPSRIAMDGLDARDIRQFIDRSLSLVREEMHSKYVTRNKIDASTFRAYFAAVREILETQCIADNSESESYFEHLSSHFASLSYEGYRQKHRARFEYIVKKTREQFLSQISAHWPSVLQS